MPSRPRTILPAWFGLGLWLAASGVAAEALFHGQVTLVDGQSLPPGALLEVRLEDQSRADVAATLISRSQTIPTGAPPFPFQLRVARSELEPNRRYGLRAQISAHGRLWYSSTRHVPVGADTPSGPIRIEVEPTGAATQAGVGYFSPLPALFTGTCYDCGSHDALQVEHLIELDAEGRYVYLREPIGTSAAGAEAEIGRWRFDPEQMQLSLHGPTNKPIRFAVENSHLLARLSTADEDGGAALELNRAAACTALEPRLTLDAVLGTSADGPTLTPCLTGEAIPIATEAQWPALEQALRNALSATGREPGSPLLVSVEATLAQRPRAEAPGVARHAVIEQILSIGPAAQCPTTD
jgi:uncharacterized lipoprotein YbaY